MSVVTLKHCNTITMSSLIDWKFQISPQLFKSDLSLGGNMLIPSCVSPEGWSLSSLAITHWPTSDHSKDHPRCTPVDHIASCYSRFISARSGWSGQRSRNVYWWNLDQWSCVVLEDANCQHDNNHLLSLLWERVDKLRLDLRDATMMSRQTCR